jgi:DNA-directed RNA polymerase specialized sigma24 family protein
MPDPNSLTRWVAALQSPDLPVRNEAARRIWQNFAGQLHALVRRRLNKRLLLREDEHDIVQTIFEGFFEAQSRQRYPLRGPGELERLLKSIAMRKISNTIARHTAGRRNVWREESSATSDRAGESFPIRDAEFDDARAIDPADHVHWDFELARIMGLLPKDLQRIVVWKLEGFTNAEIGRRINCTTRMVEMKLGKIRLALVQDPQVSARLNGTRRRYDPRFTGRDSAVDTGPAPWRSDCSEEVLTLPGGPGV